MTTFAIHELLTAAQLDTARQVLDALPACDISAATRQQYAAQADRLLTTSDTAGEIWQKLTNTRSKRTYHFRVAALRYGLQRHLQSMLNDNAYAEETPGKAQADLAVLLETLQLLDTRSGAVALESPKRRRSKRQVLSRLPDDWRLALYRRLLQIRSKHALPLAVAAVTGCRPEELRAGIELQVRDGMLSCRIRGAKVKQQQGQPERQICYEIGSNPFVDALADALEREGVTCVQVASKNAFLQALKRASRALWPQREAVTPYCLRHAAASDFKACMNEEDVSAALGHLSTDTKRLYGQRQMSRSAGAMRPVSVQAARPVKSPRADRARNRRQF